MIFNILPLAWGDYCRRLPSSVCRLHVHNLVLELSHAQHTATGPRFLGDHPQLIHARMDFTIARKSELPTVCRQNIKKTRTFNHHSTYSLRSIQSPDFHFNRPTVNTIAGLVARRSIGPRQDLTTLAATVKISGGPRHLWRTDPRHELPSTNCPTPFSFDRLTSQVALGALYQVNQRLADLEGLTVIATIGAT